MFAKLHLPKGSAYEKHNGKVFRVVDQNKTPYSHRITVVLPGANLHSSYHSDFYNTKTKKEFTIL